MTLLKPLLLISLLGLSGGVLAADASVTISSPADGAKVSASAPTKVTYEVVPGPKGDHVHLYVDSGAAAILRQLKDQEHYVRRELLPGAAPFNEPTPANDGRALPLITTAAA